MTVSVVLATYNGETFLQEQIDSVLAQTLKPDEIIVSDDGSKDGTWAILEEYQKRYPKLFRLYKNEGKHGAHENFKQAFQYVTCDLVAPCDQDDIWMPEKLERCVAAMDEKTSLVFCQEKMRNEDGIEKDKHHEMPLLRYCIFGGVVPGHLIVCRKEVLDVYSLHTEITFDMGMVLYAATTKRGKGIDYVGCVWRRHANVVTSAYSKHKTLYVEQINKWKKFWRTLRMLRKGERSEVIAKRMHSMHTIIEHYQGGDKELRITHYMEEQTPKAMLKACRIYVQIIRNEETYKKASIRNRVGMMLYAYCYPAMYWYDYHIHNSL